MSEVDVNQIDFSSLNKDVTEMKNTLNTVLYMAYFTFGSIATIAISVAYKEINKCFKKNKKIKIKDEEVRLLEAFEKVEGKIDNIAVAIKVNEKNV